MIDFDSPAVQEEDFEENEYIYDELNLDDEDLWAVGDEQNHSEDDQSLISGSLSFSLCKKSVTDSVPLQLTYHQHGRRKRELDRRMTILH